MKEQRLSKYKVYNIENHKKSKKRTQKRFLQQRRKQKK